MEITVSRRWRWWSWRCFRDGDHKHKMMMAISYHLYWLHVMFILYASYFALIGGSIIRWSLTKFQGISVLAEYAPLRQFVVPRHHVMIGCDKLYVHIQWVQARFAHAEYSASEHWDRKVEHESYSRYDQHIVMFTIENYSISRDDWAWFSWFGSRDHLDD